MQNQGQPYSNPVSGTMPVSQNIPSGTFASGAQGGIIRRVAERIENATSILVALSKDPSVDEIAAALGLSMLLDAMGKHATAIYSGRTPNALKFLKPEKTFETNANSLQDFIIALNKDKADHLRYKVEGDFVKVYITPYKSTITESDLEFSHGDYNVDLVVALGVKDTDDLDRALGEYGRIMHDAGSINITIEEPGKFGQIEWSAPEASSVCEMITKMTDFFIQRPALTPEVATALLTGIVANTDRFMNQKTTPEVMGVASRLMQSGANQMLVSVNIAQDRPLPMGAQKMKEEKSDKDDFGKKMEEELSKPLKRRDEQAESKFEKKKNVNPEKKDEKKGLDDEKDGEAQNESESSAEAKELDDLAASVLEAVGEEKKEEEAKESPEEKKEDDAKPEKIHFGATKIDDLTKSTEDEKDESKSFLKPDFFGDEKKTDSEKDEKIDDLLASEMEKIAGMSAEKELEKMMKNNASAQTTSNVMNELKEISLDDGGSQLNLRASDDEPMGIRTADEQAEIVNRQTSASVERFATMQSGVIKTDETGASDVLGENSASAGEKVVKASIYPEVQDSSRAQYEYVPEQKDYGQMMDKALAEPLPDMSMTGTSGSPITQAPVAQSLPNAMSQMGQMMNPAAQVAPVVMNQPEANHIPTMDYVADRPGANEVPAMMNGNYLMTPQAAMQVMNQMAPTQATAGQAAQMAPANMQATPVMQPMMAQPVMQQSNLPMPDVNLPVAPAPPVDFASQMMPPTEQYMTPPVVAPVEQATAQPQIMQQPLQSPVVIQPTTSTQSQQNNMTAGQLYQQNDPSAFRIPGM